MTQLRRIFLWQNRLLVAPLLIGSLKGLLAFAIFCLPGKIHEPWNFYGSKMPLDWLYLFAAWDSTFYHAIAADWYPSLMNALWAFFPLYPATIRMVGLFGLDLWLAEFLVAEIAAFTSILVFQKVVSVYLTRTEVISVTILYFLLPPVFVFTTVSYSESLFLLLSLLTWYYHTKKRDGTSAFFASLTALTRVYGLLILVPLGYDFLCSKQLKRLGFLAFPFLAFVGWLWYAYLKTGNVLAPFSAQSFWYTDTASQVRESIRLFIMYGDPSVFRFLQRFQLPIIFGIFFLGLITWLCIRTWKIDRSLGVYSSTFLLALWFLPVVSIQISPLVSLPRLLSLIFPVGVSLRIKDRRWVLLMAGLLIVLDLLAWWMFLFTDTFH